MTRRLAATVKWSCVWIFTMSMVWAINDSYWFLIPAVGAMIGAAIWENVEDICER
jgi:hypothetical protein